MSNGNTRPKANAGSRLLAWLPWACLVIGLGATYAQWHHTRSDLLEAQRDRFNFYVDEVVGDIESRMRSYEQVLNGVEGLFSASENVARSEFKAYVESLRLGKNYPGIQGIGFAQLLPAKELRRHEERIRTSGFPDYALHPAGERELYSSIVYIEPFDWRNQRAFGYDMYAHPARREAMDRAWDSGGTALSGKVTLVQETDANVQPGFLMYVPVYRYHAPRATPEQRRQNLAGWVYAPFRMNDLMQGVLRKHYGERQSALDLEIYDGVVPTPAAMLYDSDNGSQLNVAAASPLSASRQVRIAGRTWTMLIRSLQGTEAGPRLNAIALIGGAGSLMMAVLLWLLINHRRQALADLDDLYNLAPCGYHSLDTTGRFIRINQTELGWLGYEREELIGQPFATVLSDESVAVLQENFPRLKATGQIRNLEFQLRRKDGTSFPALLSATAVFDAAGRFLMTRSTLHDISQRKDAERELQRLNQLYAVLNRANQAIVRIRDLDRLLEEICHVAVEHGGLVMAWAGHVKDGKVVPYAHWGKEEGYLEQARIMVADRALGAGPTGTAIREGRHYVCDDIANDPHMAPWRELALQRGYHSSAAFPVRIDGEVVGAINLYAPTADYFTPAIIELLDDLTEDVSFAMNAHADAARRRQAEADLSRLNEQLEQRVQQRTRELEVANKELEAFSYSVSHDLRAPLRGIDGFSQVLLKRYADKLDDTGRDYLERVRRASQRMGELIDDLLHLSRVTRGALRRQEVDLSAQAEALIKDLQRASPERQVQVTIQEDMRVFGDPGLLRVVLDNLLGNAWKFTRRIEDATIEFACRQGDNDLIYFVRDNGAGFDQAYAKKLFQVFQRLHGDNEFEGTGIGLATVQRVILRHHGTVGAEGETGKGATFWFTLPQRDKLRDDDMTDNDNERGIPS